MPRVRHLRLVCKIYNTLQSTPLGYKVLWKTIIARTSKQARSREQGIVPTTKVATAATTPIFPIGRQPHSLLEPPWSDPSIWPIPALTTTPNEKHWLVSGDAEMLPLGLGRLWSFQKGYPRAPHGRSVGVPYNHTTHLKFSIRVIPSGVK